MPKEQYMCQLCANHGFFNQPKKGHKQKCPYKECPCDMCALNTKRRALDQIERQLRQISADSTPTCSAAKSIDARVESSDLNFLHPDQGVKFAAPSHSTLNCRPKKRPLTDVFVRPSTKQPSIFRSIELLVKPAKLQKTRN